jgi:hypothetical protein
MINQMLIHHKMMIVFSHGNVFPKFLTLINYLDVFNSIVILQWKMFAHATRNMALCQWV